MPISSTLDTLADRALDDAHDIDDSGNRTLMRRYIADSAIELAEIRKWQSLRNTWSFNTTIDQPYYTLNNVEYVYSMFLPDGTPVERIDKEDIDRLSTTNTSTACVFAEWGWDSGLIVVIWPTPTSVTAINVNGLILQPRISGTSDVPIFDNRFEDLLILGGVWRWKLFRQNDVEVANALYRTWQLRANNRKLRDSGAMGAIQIHVDDFQLALRQRRTNEGV